MLTEAREYDCAEDSQLQMSDFARKYLQVTNTNNVTRLIASYLTGQINEIFTKQGIDSISPESTSDIESVFQLIKVLGAEDKVKEISTINPYLKVTLKSFTKLDEANLIGNHLKMRSEYSKIMKAIVRLHDSVA